MLELLKKLKPLLPVTWQKEVTFLFTFLPLAMLAYGQYMTGGFTGISLEIYSAIAGALYVIFRRYWMRITKTEKLVVNGVEVDKVVIPGDVVHMISKAVAEEMQKGVKNPKPYNADDGAKY